jgi:hypothetical protein
VTEVEPKKPEMMVSNPSNPYAEIWFCILASACLGHH